MIRLYATVSGLILERDGAFAGVPDVAAIDRIFHADDPRGEATSLFDRGARAQAPEPSRPPLLSQEVWAAGVTYYRSRTARMEESKDAGGGSFYDRVYEADRPELFFKATPHRVAGPGGPVRIRSDSHWNVPEPELTLAINRRGAIFGYTIGNDMSSRDIEGENPLYLPQAKVYAGSAALGPCLVIDRALPGPEATIAIAIQRGEATVFTGQTTIGQIKRPLPSLAEWLFRDNSFPHGCYLMTGTGIVPPDAFTLAAGDEIRITLEPVGTLVNTVVPPHA
ncbi:MAG TPA: fumarylacetoacetate hydrolase family protein [Vicinamibacterales bacterium]|nr:fumarylacetoacetate hydrolase family protein [Vicinamibacterales bacterium]